MPTTSPATLRREYIGAEGRYRLDTFRTRFGDIAYLVADLHQMDEYDMPAIIRQEPTREAALRGLIRSAA